MTEGPHPVDFDAVDAFFGPAPLTNGAPDERLEAEALENDPEATSSRYAHLSPAERQRVLADAAIWRDGARRSRRVDLEASLGARRLSELSTDPPPPLLLDRLDPAGHTILYGQGGTGKGVVATSWIRELVKLGHKVLILDYEHHPDEWARRYAGLAGADGADRIIHVSPLAASWMAHRGAIWRQEEAIADIIDVFEATFIVIDSIVVACGGADPMDPGTPARYAATLEYLGRPALSLAHTPKDGSLATPFGSTFWHNLARVTWSLHQDGGQRVLTHRKANNHALLGRFLLDVTWWEGRPGDVAERPYAAALAARIDEVLGTDSLTVSEVVDRLADEDDVDEPVKADSVSRALRRGVRDHRFTVDGQGRGARWRRAEA